MHGEWTGLIEYLIWEENETNNLKDKKKQSKLEEIEKLFLAWILFAKTFYNLILLSLEYFA